MTLLDIWITTTVINFFYRIMVNIQTYKAYADLGYIYNGKMFKSIEEQVNEEDDFVTWFFYKFGKFIPVYNLYQTLMRKLNYCIDAEENIDILEEYQIIEKMTLLENDEYNQKKTGLNAYKYAKKIK